MLLVEATLASRMPLPALPVIVAPPDRVTQYVVGLLKPQEGLVRVRGMGRGRDTIGLHPAAS